MQPWHHDAQKLRTIGEPRSDASDTGLPSIEVSRKVGAALPRSGEADAFGSRLKPKASKATSGTATTSDHRARLIWRLPRGGQPARPRAARAPWTGSARVSA